ncbi:MAG: sugar-specific transcriptional regulator TrmB [halophilic archaeon J07HB67]|nr:MAG: sugar-specific transcriptional regulator TrmB [halophilic archaeon J07HB67]
MTDEQSETTAGDDESDGGRREGLRSAAERVGETATTAADGFDERLIDLLAWVLDTETRAQIYAYLRQSPSSTSDEIADATDLYPSTVREALAQLHDDGFVTRGKRTATGAGNNPYEYEAIPPVELVDGVVDEVQSGLNAVLSLDRRLGRDDAGPVQITVTATDDGDPTERVGTEPPNTSADGAAPAGDPVETDDPAETDGGAPTDGR